MLHTKAGSQQMQNVFRETYFMKPPRRPIPVYISYIQVFARFILPPQEYAIMLVNLVLLHGFKASRKQSISLNAFLITGSFESITQLMYQ